jgi:hypothetical protein
MTATPLIVSVIARKVNVARYLIKAEARLDGTLDNCDREGHFSDLSEFMRFLGGDIDFTRVQHQKDYIDRCRRNKKTNNLFGI